MEEQEIKLKEWLEFLENPESKEVKSYMESNLNMKKAKSKLEKMSEDKKMQRIAELREKAILDEKEVMYTGYCKGEEVGLRKGIAEGRKEGIAEGRKEGIAEGRKEGIVEGRKEGIVEGRKEGRKEVAKRLKEKGIDIETIIQVTNLPKEEIINLK